MKPRTLFDKIWDAHVVETLPDGTALLYIDLHLTHEVTTPQAYAGLRAAARLLGRVIEARRAIAGQMGQAAQHEGDLGAVRGV